MKKNGTSHAATVEGDGRALHVRLPQNDEERLQRLLGRLPMRMTRSALARRALSLGLESLDRDPTLIVRQQQDH